MAKPFLRPPDGPDVAYEFFAPFAHVPGKYEWCRIRSPTHGLFDAFIALGASPSEPASVYVNSAEGAAFMAERYPECRTRRVASPGLLIKESPDGRTVLGTLRAPLGPLAEADMVLRARPDALPRQVPYGGEGHPVWGSRWTCWGVDLALDGYCEGHLVLRRGGRQPVGEPCIVTQGSFGRLAPLHPARTSKA